MRRYGIYLSIVMEDGEIIGVYIVSATAEDEGTVARSDDYEKVKLHEYLTSKDTSLSIRRILCILQMTGMSDHLYS